MQFLDAFGGGRAPPTPLCRTLAAGVLAIGFHVGLLASPVNTVADQDPPQPLAESTRGMVYSFRPSSIRSHPLGHAAVIHGESAQLRPLDSRDPRSPMFRSVDSSWVVACHDGTFSIVEDRFLGEDGQPVAVFTAAAEEQEMPQAGSVADSLLWKLCAYIGRRIPLVGGVRP